MYDTCANCSYWTTRTSAIKIEAAIQTSYEIGARRGYSEFPIAQRASGLSAIVNKHVEDDNRNYKMKVIFR